MTFSHFSSLLLASSMVCSAAYASSPVIKVEDAWVRGTVSSQKATGAFMRLLSPQNVRLIAVSSPVAGSAEVHEMAMENNVMSMRQISGLDIPAGKTVELKPGGYHVMLMDLKKPAKAGDTIRITLKFEDAAKKTFEQTVTASVKPLGKPDEAMKHGAGHGDMGAHKPGQKH